jgi:acetyl esterase/lipase
MSSKFKSMRYFILIVSILSLFQNVYGQKKSYKIHLEWMSVSREIPDDYEVDSFSFIVRSEDTTEILQNQRIPPGYDSTACQYPSPCSDIYFAPIPGTSCDPAPTLDPFGNQIDAVGWYGADTLRQRYYVYYHSSKSDSSPVVLLIHGGGWFSGPNPKQVNGYPFSVAPDDKDSSLVRDLLEEGYVVVSLLYRLVKYGDNTTDILANDLTFDDQLDDVDSAVSHIRTNFSSCLDIDANSIQILGESAGAHLALMYAYSRADTSYVRSVISMYAPTNLNEYTDYLLNANNSYTCGTVFYEDNCPPENEFEAPYFPRYLGRDTSVLTESENFTLFTCVPKYKECGGFPPTINLPKVKVFKSYYLVQSAVPDTTSNPINSADIEDYSPHAVLSDTRKVPTFIMHGKSDLFVPYDETTVDMEDALDDHGGIIQNAGSNIHDGTNVNIPTTYSGSDIHLIKKYDAANHGWAAAGLEPTELDREDLKIIRDDVVIWLNGHK